MSAIYLYKCQACQATGKFAGGHEAARANWTLAEVRHGETLRHVVRCPACTPPWVATVMAAPSERRKPREVK